MLLKLLLIAILILIAYSLGSGLYLLIRHRGGGVKMAKALTWRVGLTLLLFIILLIAHAMGWIQPHGLFIN